MFARILKDSAASTKAWNTRGRGSKAPAKGMQEKDTKLVEHYAKYNDPKADLNSVLKNFSPADQREVLMMTRKSQAQKTTAEEMTVTTEVTIGDKVVKYREYTPERRAVHAKIINEILSDKAIAAATPAPGERPTYIVLGGRGGSGKSKFTDGSIKEFDAKKFLVLDSDAIKEKLKPPYKGWNAFSVHEESSDIFDEITVAAQKRGLNIIHDSTLRSDGIGSTIAQMKKSGYKIEGHYMFLSRQEAAKRAVQRYLKDGPENRGRLVPPEVVLSNTKNEENFQRLSKYFDKWSAYDNQGEKGSEPKKISGSEK